MDAPEPPIVTSSARRPRHPRLRLLETAVVAIAVVAVVAVLSRGSHQHEATIAPPAGLHAPTATPTATATPPPAPLVEQRGPWVSAPTPIPPTADPPTPAGRLPRRARPSATPAVAQCLAARWSAGQSAAAWGQVLVTIDVVNRCGRILEPTEMAFRVAGYRQGALVQTANGHAFQRLYPDRSETVIIGLPGSIDWYDRITVEVTD